MVQDATSFDWEKESRAIAAKIKKTPTLSKAEVMKMMPNEQLAELIEKHGSAFVVLNKAGTSCLEDPSTRLPFSTTIKQRAEQVAKEVGGVVVTLNEAIRVLTSKK